MAKISPLIQIRETDQILPAPTEENQAMLAGMFFALNRQQYNESIFDKNKEQRQVEAVSSFLSGFHLQMGTGEGKSTTVFPIVALVESLTNQKKSVILATSDESNLGDLEDSTRKLIHLAHRQNIELSGISIEKNSQNKPGDSVQQRMVIQSLTSGQLSPETEDEIRKNYWKNILDETEDQYGFIYRKKKDQKPRIILATDRDLVFSFADDKQRFISEAPEIYMDEADIPYNRKTPYKQTPPATFFAPDEVISSTISWITHQLIWQQLQSDDFKPGEKGYELTEEAAQRIKSIRLTAIIEEKPFQFDRLVSLISKRLGLTTEQRKAVGEKLLTTFKAGDAVNSQTRISEESDITVAESLNEEIARRLSGFYKKSGVFYKSSKNQEGVFVRDHYIDQILEDHQFTPDDQIAILAIEGKYDFVPLDQPARKTLTFPTFVSAIREKLHCASGTLKFPNSETKKIEETNFSHFLKTYTGRKIYDITQPEIKDLPRPEILDNDDDAVEKLAEGVKKLQGKKPVLVISYDIDSSQKIFKRLKKTYGKKVQYIPTKPSNPGDIIEYNKKVKKYYRQLADGDIDVLVSSGASGFAVNIVKSDGSYPDLHITLHNLPANRQLLMQNLNRRRKPGSEFSWYISRQYLDLYLMLFEEKTDLLSHFLGKIDALDIRQRLDRVRENPDLALPLVLDILKQAERFESVDDEFSIVYDSVVEQLNQRIEDKIIDKLLEPDNLQSLLKHNITGGKKTDFLKMFASQLGVPERIYEDLKNHLTLVLGTIQDKDMEMKLNKAVNTKIINSYLEDLTNQWFEHRFGLTNEAVKINYDSIVLLDHVRYDAAIVKPLSVGVSDSKSKVEWVKVYYNGEFHLGYRTPNRQVFLFYVHNGGQFLRLFDWPYSPYNKMIHGFDQKKSVVLFDFLKR